MSLKLTRRGQNLVVGSVVLLTAGAAIVLPVQAESSSKDLPRGWQHVNQSLADAMAEGGSEDATTRDWEACFVKYRKNSTTVKCPDGYKERWSNVTGP